METVPESDAPGERNIDGHKGELRDSNHAGSGSYHDVLQVLCWYIPGNIQILLTLPVGTATVECSFSQMKMIKTRLRNRLPDCNLSRLMRIAIEGPELQLVNFNDILEVYKEKNRPNKPYM